MRFVIPKRNPLIPVFPIPPSLEHLLVRPVPAGVHRPQWSVMIPTYNRPEYLEQALESVLVQAPGADVMQIAVVDNCSTIGDIEAIVWRVGGKRVEYYRQPENIGFQGNVTECINLARGYWVHLLHDDNIVMPGFYEANWRHIETYQCDVVFSQSIVQDKVGVWHTITYPVSVINGIVKDPMDIIFSLRTFVLDSLVAARSVYEKTGGYTTLFHFGCDHEMCSRLFQVARIGFLSRPYMISRIHDGQDGNVLNFTKEKAIREYLLAYQVALQPSNTPKHRRLAYNMFGDILSLASDALARRGLYADALRIGVWAFRVSPSFARLFNFLRVVYRVGLGLYIPRWRKIRHLLGRCKRLALRLARI